MALLGTYGGADDVRIYQNRILAEQAGALLPAGGTKIITYPGITLTALPVMSVVGSTVPGEYTFTLDSPGLVDSNDSYKKSLKLWANSTVGTSEGATLIISFGIDNKPLPTYTINLTPEELAIPTVYYAEVIYTTSSNPPRVLSAYTLGKCITTPPPVLRTATTRSKRKAVTA